jgi:hypothetical protein
VANAITSASKKHRRQNAPIGRTRHGNAAEVHPVVWQRRLAGSIGSSRRRRDAEEATADIEISGETLNPKKLRLFFSYASNDRELAAAVRSALAERGVDVYPGATWPGELEAALRKAHGMVVFGTRAFLDSPMASAEVELALMTANLANRVVVLGDNTKLPWVLAKQPRLPLSAPPPKLAGQILAILKNQV